jgi:hypothetical protein
MAQGLIAQDKAYTSPKRYRTGFPNTCKRLPEVQLRETKYRISHKSVIPPPPEERNGAYLKGYDSTDRYMPEV